MQTIVDIRYAFERDMMRRMVGNGGIIVLCVECEEEFDRVVPNQIVCEVCRKGRIRRQTRERVRRHRERNPATSIYYGDFTEVDKDNLITALIRGCVQDVIGRYAQGNEAAGLWLEDCAEPFMAACGEHINIDEILETIDDQKYLGND